MKKIVILLMSILLVVGCTKKEEKTKITTNNNLEYTQSIKLHDIIQIENGTIITENKEINTNMIGKQNIEVEYINEENKKKKHNFEINIKDNVPPVILSKNIYTIKKGDNIDLINQIVYGDNYDNNVKCEIIGEYDINTIGEYKLKFIATDSSNNQTIEEFTLNVSEEIQTSSWNPTPIKFEDFKKEYKTENTLIGIDVSTWQGNIDWNKVKNSGAEFAIIRIGFGHNKNNELILDNKFIQNIKGAKEAGLKVGLYFYSYARNNEEAINQANWIIENLNGETLDLPIAFDWEIWDKFNDYLLSFTDLNNIAKSFIDTIHNNGYEAMNYGSANYLRYIWNIPEYPTWLAHYTDKTTYEKDYYIWQRTSSGVINGIDGFVDLNVLYNTKKR